MGKDEVFVCSLEGNRTVIGDTKNKLREENFVGK